MRLAHADMASMPPACSAPMPHAGLAGACLHNMQHMSKQTPTLQTGICKQGLCHHAGAHPEEGEGEGEGQMVDAERQ